MIYNISGEQPFQVLSDSFSVSPSQSGYDLYLSADGFNYSRFATVASGTTKQFTGMNNGNYYILSGNTSDVKVNWERDCGGGGGGAAGVSSLDGQTGALTTKTIGGQSILGTGDIPVGGGSNVYYVDGDSINNYSGVVDEIYHKLSSGETAYATVKCDYAKYPVAKAEIYEYQEGQPGDPDYLRQEGFQIVAARFGSDGYAIRSGIVRAFRYEGRDGNGYSCGQSWDYAMPEVSGGDYMIVEDLSAITNPTEGMVAFVKGTIAVDRLANVSAYKLSGWAGGMYQFVDGEDYTIYRSQINDKWNFPYKSGTPDIGYYWQELDSNLYIRYQGGNIWVAWNSENFPNARMMGNNFTNSDNKWGETSGQTFYITLNHSEGLNQYRDGKWVPMKKQYWFQDCISSSALSEEICHRTAEGEMDITLVENDGVMICQYSSPNSWNVGSTAFVMLRVDTNSNHLQYFRKFVNWDSYNWAQDANWDYTLPQSSGLHTKPIFRDYWYVYYDTTTSGFSYGIDQTLTPITWGTGTTCSGMWIFDKDGTYQYLGTPTDVDKAFFFNLRVKTSEGTRIYGYPSFSRVVLDTPVTLTNEQSESITFSDKVYFDYGDCVLSFYFNNDWRFGGIEINFR